MIRNYFYLIVGFICLLSSITHTLNGLNTSLSILSNSIIDTDTQVVFTYIWHIIAAENIVFGMALLIMAFHKNRMTGKYIVWFIIAILAVRWVTITSVTLLNNFSNITKLIPESLVMWLIIILLWLGSKKKEKVFIN